MVNSVIDAQLTKLEWEHNIVVNNNFKDSYPLLYNGKLCIVHYNDKENSVFQTEDKGYIWKKPNTLYLMSDIYFIRLLLKIDNVQRQYEEENPSIIKNVYV